MSQVLFFEAVEVGCEIELTHGPITTAHLMRWSAATENWHKIHYDQKFTTEHEGLPGLLINGSLKQQILLQMLKNWAGPTAHVAKMSFQFRSMNIVGERLTAWARVTCARREAEHGLVDLETGIRNERGLESTPGKAVVAVPFENGVPIPYPYQPSLPAS